MGITPGVPVNRAPPLASKNLSGRARDSICSLRTYDATLGASEFCKMCSEIKPAGIFAGKKDGSMVSVLSQLSQSFFHGASLAQKSKDLPPLISYFPVFKESNILIVHVVFAELQLQGCCRFVW